MQYLLLFLPLLFVAGDSPVEWLQAAVIELPDTLQGEEISYTFRFRNLTEAPLVVDNVRVGCGCTATEWQEEPIAPGAEGSINVTYDAMSAGFYRKYVKVFFVGHRGGHKLWMEGFVEANP
jgi:hypothetical protein